MGYTNETTHYGIPLPLGSDLTTPMDYNESAEKIDRDLYANTQGVAQATGKVNDLEVALGTTNDNVTAVTGRVTTLEGTVTTQGNAITQLQLDVADVRADALDMIEAVDEGTAQVATIAVSTGNYFRYNDVLYIATDNIAIGDTIVPNTNCKATNVGTELTELKSDLSSKQNKTDNTLNTTSKTVVGAINEINSSLAPSNVTISPLTDITFNGSRFYKSGQVINLNSLVRYSNNIASGQGFQTFANLDNNLPTSQVFFPVSTYSRNIGTGTIKTDGTLQFDFPNGYTANDDIVMNVTYIN